MFLEVLWFSSVKMIEKTKILLMSEILGLNIINIILNIIL